MQTTQLYEMIIVRHGLMAVGQPFSGKSSSLAVLAGALTDLAEQGALCVHVGGCVHVRTCSYVFHAGTCTAAPWRTHTYTLNCTCPCPACTLTLPSRRPTRRPEGPPVHRGADAHAQPHSPS